MARFHLDRLQLDALRCARLGLVKKAREPHIVSRFSDEEAARIVGEHADLEEDTCHG